MLFAGWKVRIVKNSDQGLEMLPEAPGRGQHFQGRGHSFSLYRPTLQYCAKVMQTNFDEIPGFSWLFEEILLETIFQRNFPAFL